VIEAADRYVRGAGEFSDDRWVETATHAVVVRSPHAHARIASIAVSAALARSGVLAIFTGRDIVEHLRPLPCLVGLTSRDGRPRAEADRAILATDRVRHVGDGVAFVVAETLSQALDAAEAVQVIYEPLPATTRPGDVSTVPIWSEAPDNLCFDWGTGDAAACDRLFATATHVTRLRFEIPRIVVHPMEPRTAVGQYDPACSRYTLVSPTQGVHLVRRVIAASFGIAEDRFRVISPDVGGGFGSRIFAYPEHALVLWAARALGRPVSWCANRSESFLSDTQGRGRVTEAALALDADGRFLALRVKDTADLGAYLSQYGPYTAAGCGAPVQAGAYRISAMDLRVRGYFTNTTPIDSYRGTGRPEATYVLERLIDQAAFELGIDRAALRERNMRAASDTPVVLSTGQAVDGGRFLDNQRICLQVAEYGGFSDRRGQSEARGSCVASVLAITLRRTAA
jgi:carbon-monoxide dehydrogenase large subunit